MASRHGVSSLLFGFGLKAHGSCNQKSFNAKFFHYIELVLPLKVFEFRIYFDGDKISSDSELDKISRIRFTCK